MKRKLLVALSTLVLCVLLLPAAAFAEDYDLWVGDIQVTSENASDVFGDGTVKFDASNNTLYLTDYVATGTDTGRTAMLESHLSELTIVLDGNNALIGNNEAFGIYHTGDMTIKDAEKSAVPGTLAVTAGNGTTSVGIMAPNGTFAINSGTVIATGGVGSQGNSYGLSASTLTINGGTLIATGGAATSYTAGIFAPNFIISSDASDAFVFAQGGENTASDQSYGIWAPTSCQVNNGILIARAGIVYHFDGELGSYGRLAISGPEPTIGSNEKLAAAVSNGRVVSRIVCVPASYEEVSSLTTEATLGKDVYFVTADTTSSFPRINSLDLNGHTALVVSLVEYGGNGTYNGLTQNSLSSVEGPGRLIGVGGMLTGTDSTSIGIDVSDLTLKGAELIGIGGLCRNTSAGIYASTLNAYEGSNIIAVASPVSGEYSSSIGIITSDASFYDVSEGVAIGGMAGYKAESGNADSTGIYNVGYVTTEDSAKVLAAATTALDCSWGTYNTIHAKGGLIATIGGKAGYNSSGNDAGIEVYPGGKIVALGGIGGTSSYGSYTNPYPIHGGDLVVAGRSRAYYDSYSSYGFNYAEGLTATGYTDYAGTEGAEAIETGTSLNVIGNYKRIVVATPSTIERICGENYANETAAAISKQTFEESEYVVLARDDDFADALGATGLAGTLDCPIILTDRTALSEAAAAEINRLGATKVYIIGGTGAMKAQLETDLETQCGITDVTRLWGENSYDTSLACAKELVAKGGHPDIAIIAMSTNFQDALSMSSFAYKFKAPVILQTWGDTSADRGFTDEAAAWLEGKIVIVAGGTGAISDESLAGCRVEARLWGESGYDTSNEIAKWMVENNLLDPTNIIIACGAQAPKGVDALAGAALGGKLGAPMLLVNSNEAMEAADTTTIDGFYTDNANKIKATYVLGGSYVVPQDLYEHMQAISGAIDLSA